MNKLPFENMTRQAMRVAKNYTKGYSDMQTKVREATSNDPWGPSGSQMNELAQATYNQQDFIEIMEMMDKRLNDKGKNWRHVFKALTLLDYILHAGSENVVLYFQENMYIVKTLREFVFVDEDGKDQGSNVRQKAKDITNLLMDDARMREQRRSRSDMRDRMSGGRQRDDSPDSSDEERRRAAYRKAPKDTSAFNRSGPEDDDLARAIEESKRSARQDQTKYQQKSQQDTDLEEAMRLSKEEEDRRKRMLDGNNSSLFDPDAPENQNRQTPNFGWDSLVDTGNDQQQPQMQMPMITGFAQFNPYAQQQQEEYMRQQQQMLEMQRQMEMQAQMAAQAQAEHDAYAAMMAQQAYMQQQQQLAAMQAQMAQQQQQQPLVPQQTSIGSNNPFAAFSPEPASPPPMPELQQQLPNMPKPILKQPKDDGKYSHLAGLLGNRDDGLDTFGNQGNLRYGHGSNRLAAQQTGGTNPFQRQQQQQQRQQQGNDQPFFEL
ncbi:MAG: hypothetical protein CYPHOPRED_003628 [Cyphobasidiales sp. Tagirdzhanova-0007]|nr:MAG: hypothetical protein CYPHOPRED_003628 [Cyphobasidiales sp. Tagirdzhanova-0007]